MISMFPILEKHSFKTQVKRIILGRNKSTFFFFETDKDLRMDMDSDMFNG